MGAARKKKNHNNRTFSSLIIGFLLICAILLSIFIGVHYYQQFSQNSEQNNQSMAIYEGRFQKVTESEYKNQHWKKVTFPDFDGKTLAFYIPTDWKASLYISIHKRPEVEIFPIDAEASIQSMSPEDQRQHTIVVTVLQEKIDLPNLQLKVNLQSDRRYTSTLPIKVHSASAPDGILSEKENDFKEILLVNTSDDVLYVRAGYDVQDTNKVFETIVSSITLE